MGKPNEIYGISENYTGCALLPKKYNILEIKYDKKYDKYFQFFIKYLPLRLDKNSKYVFGVNKILENKII